MTVPRPWFRGTFWVATALCFVAFLPTLAFGTSVIYYDNSADVHIDAMKMLHRLLYAWTPDYFLGMHTGFMQEYLTPYSAVYALLHVAGVGSFGAQFIVIFATFLLIALSTYVSLRFIAPDMGRFGRLTAATAASWNIYVAFNMHGSSIMLLPYAAMPAFVAVCAAYLDRRITLLRAALFTALISLFASATNPPLLAMDACVVLIFIGVAFVAGSDRRSIAKRTLAYCLGCGLATLLVNVYWIVPFIDYFHDAWLGGILIETTAMQNASTSFANTLRGFGQWAIGIGDDQGPYYLWAASYAGTTIFSVMTWLVLTLAFVGQALRRRIGRSQAFFWALLAVSLPLVVGYYHGAAGPAVTERIYDFLYTKVPGFQMFRSTYKWEGVVVFAIAGLLGYCACGVRATTMGAGWRERLSRAAQIVPVAAVAVSFLPVLIYGINPPEAKDLPAWTRTSLERLPATMDERGALFPDQYLEPFLWGRPTYFIESAISPLPLIYGYLGSAPHEDADQILKRAYREARSGSPDARAVFATLSAKVLIQRDDFLSLDDFAFPGRSVPTGTSLAHDIIARVLGGSPVSVDGATRTYAGPGLDVYRATAIGLIAAIPSGGVATSFDAEALARGLTVIDGGRLDDKQLRELVRDGAAADTRPSAILALAVSQFFHTGESAYSSNDQATVRAAGGRRELFVSLSQTPADGPPVARVDGGKPVTCDMVYGGIASCGTWFFPFADTHHIEIVSHAPLGYRAVFIPPVLLKERIQAVLAATHAARAARYDASAAIRTAAGSRAGVFRSAPPLTWSSENAVDVPVPLGPPIDDLRFDGSQVARSELLVLPVAQTAVSDTLWLPRSMYAQASTYEWNRGGPQAWMVLGPDSHFSVYAPAHNERATITMRLCSVIPSASINLVVNGRVAGTLRLSGASRSRDGAHVADLCQGVESWSVVTRLKAGRNDVALATAGAPRQMSAVSDAGAAASMEAVLALPSIPVVSVPERLSGSAPLEPQFRAWRLRLPSTRIWGDPVLTLHRHGPQGRAFLAVRDIHNGTALLRTVELPQGASDATVSIADMLPNTFSDRGDQIVGVWLLRPGSRGAASAFDVTYSSTLRTFSPVSSIPLRTASISGASLAARSAKGVDVTYPRGIAAGRVTIAVPWEPAYTTPLCILQLRGSGEGLHARVEMWAHRSGAWTPLPPLTSSLGSGLFTASCPAGADHVRMVLSFSPSSLLAVRRFHLDPPMLMDSSDGAPSQRSSGNIWTSSELVVPDANARSVGGVTFVRRSPVALNVEADRAVAHPFLIVFGESFDPMWHARLGTQTLAHLEVDGYANAWLVPGIARGQTIDVEFAGQRRFDYAAAISFATLAALTLMFVVRRSRGLV